MKRTITLSLVLITLSLLLLVTFVSSESDKFNLGRCISSCLKDTKNQTHNCHVNQHNESEVCEANYKLCKVNAKNNTVNDKNNTNETLKKINFKDCSNNFTTCKSLAQSKAKTCEKNLIQGCKDTCKSLDCHTYYWFNDSSKDCSNQSFCGDFKYKGLKTFNEQSKCLKEANETITKCNNLNARITETLNKTQSCKKDSDCKIKEIKEIKDKKQTPCNISICEFASLNKESHLDRLNSMFKEYDEKCTKTCPLISSPIITCASSRNATAKCDNGKCTTV